MMIRIRSYAVLLLPLLFLFSYSVQALPLDSTRTQENQRGVSVQNRLRLRSGRRILEIIHLGRGHTSGDIVVHLPNERVVIGGDLVIWPVPYIGSPQSHPGDWGETLSKLLALQPKAIVPGHGPVLRDDAYVRLMIRLFASLKEQVSAAVARGESLELTQKSVNLDEFQKLFAGASRIRKLVFRNYVLGAGVEAAFRDATGK